MFKTTQSRIVMALCVFFAILIAGTVWVILLFVSPQLKNSESDALRYQLDYLAKPIVEQMNRVKAQIRSITQSVAEMESAQIDHLLPYLVDQYQDVNVFGGGIWPLPEKRVAGQIKFSTFYARNKDNVLAVNTYWNSAESDNYFEQTWYKEGMTAPRGECVWAKAYQDDASPQPRTNCAMPIYKNGTLYGVATIDVTLGFFNQLAQTMSSLIQGKVLIIEENGKIVGDETSLSQFDGLKLLADIGNEWQLSSQTMAMMSELRQKEMTVLQKEFNVNGEAHTIMISRIPHSPWFIAADVPSSLLTKQTDQILSRLGIVQIPAALLLLLFMLIFIRKQMKLLSGLNKNIHSLSADGADLTKRLALSKSPEFNRVIDGFNNVMIFLQGTLKQVSESSQSIISASISIAKGNEALSGRTQEQTKSVDSTVHAMEAIKGKVDQSAESAAHANELAVSAAKLANDGVSVVSQAVSTMSHIQGASQKIVDIISVIDGIAFQTNILALNAAVEAARAGEQGRGFAVVASEVRSLAQRSAQSSKEIKDLIENSVASINNGTELVNQVGHTMNQLMESVNNVTQLMGNIMSSSQEQRSDIGQVNHDLSMLDSSTEKNADMVSEVSALAQALKESAQQLEQVVSGFKF